MEEKRSSYKDYVGKNDEKIIVDNSKICLKEIGCGDMDQILQTRNSGQ
jgi:hypothetical protein